MKTRDLLAALRQWLQPAPLRIDASEAQAQRSLLGMAQAWAARDAAERALLDKIAALEKAVSIPVPSDADIAFVRKLATSTWRLDQQAKRLPAEGVGRAVRNRLDALLAVLATNEIEIEDFTGREFDRFEFWDQVVSDQTPKERSIITSMQAPRVRWRGGVIQAGTPITGEGAQ